MNFLRETPSAMDYQNGFRAVRNWFRHNAILIKSILFIFGLGWSTIMVKAFVRILIKPLSSGGGAKVCDLPSVVVVNLHQGISSVFVVAFTYATGGCLVRFLVFSTTASIVGVIYYMFLAAGNDDNVQLHLCLAMLVKVSVQAALSVTLKEVLDNHFRPMYHYAMTTRYVRATEADNGSRQVQARPVYLLSLWICLLILSLVSASASNFFFLEASTFSGRNYIFAILSLDNLLRFTEASFRGIQRHNQESMGLLRIGIALLYSVVCCTIAMGTGMSVFWLTPQFFILALMAEVAKDGFQSLYESQVPSHLKRYGSALGELARGLGGVLGLLCIFIFRGWDFSFNTYCIFMAVLSVSNFIFYLLVAFWDVGGLILLEDEEIVEHLE